MTEFYKEVTSTPLTQKFSGYALTTHVISFCFINDTQERFSFKVTSINFVVRTGPKIFFLTSNSSKAITYKRDSDKLKCRVDIFVLLGMLEWSSFLTIPPSLFPLMKTINAFEHVRGARIQSQFLQSCLVGLQ